MHLFLMLHRLPGTALVRTHFPEWKYDPEAYYLSCLFHDIGTADRYLSTTKMSFEFKGAIVAREFILEHGGEEDLADAICEVRDHESTWGVKRRPDS